MTPHMQTSPDTFPSFLPSDPLAQKRRSEALADGVSATLQMTRALIEARRHVDLAGLDQMMGLLCAQTLDLPPDQGRSLRPRLIELLHELDELTKALPVP
jgi:hypothetical protein